MVIFSRMITILNEENESRALHRDAVVVENLYSCRLQSYPTKNKTAPEKKCLQKFVGVRSQTKCYSDGHFSLEIIRAGEELCWMPANAVCMGQRKYFCPSGSVGSVRKVVGVRNWFS